MKAIVLTRIPVSIAEGLVKRCPPQDVLLLDTSPLFHQCLNDTWPVHGIIRAQSLHTVLHSRPLRLCETTHPTPLPSQMLFTNVSHYPACMNGRGHSKKLQLPIGKAPSRSQQLLQYLWKSTVMAVQLLCPTYLGWGMRSTITLAKETLLCRFPSPCYGVH